MVKAIGDALSVTDKYLRDMRQLIYRASPMCESPADELLNVVQSVSKNQDETASPNRNAVWSNSICSSATFKVDPAFAERVHPYRYGTGGARVMAMELISQQGEPAVAFRFNEWITVRAHIECYKDVDFLNCCILIRNRNGIEITHATSFESGFSFPVLKNGDRIVVDIRFRNILKGGEGYTIHYTVNDTRQIETQEILDLIELAMPFESLRDETHPIWYLIYYPFQFQYKKIPSL
jgi:hypothetical protein